MSMIDVRVLCIQFTTKRYACTSKFFLMFPVRCEESAETLQRGIMDQRTPCRTLADAVSILKCMCEYGVVDHLPIIDSYDNAFGILWVNRLRYFMKPHGWEIEHVARLQSDFLRFRQRRPM